MTKYLFAILWLLYTVSAEATVYWASPSGGAASCAAASGASDPGQYRTLAQVRGCVAAGDTIKLKNGTYSGTGTVWLLDGTAGTGNTVNGSSGSPITVTAE